MYQFIHVGLRSRRTKSYAYAIVIGACRLERKGWRGILPLHYPAKMYLHGGESNSDVLLDHENLTKCSILVNVTWGFRPCRYSVVKYRTLVRLTGW